jgi:hypothetical protein
MTEYYEESPEQMEDGLKELAERLMWTAPHAQQADNEMEEEDEDQTVELMLAFEQKFHQIVEAKERATAPTAHLLSHKELDEKIRVSVIWLERLLYRMRRNAREYWRTRQQQKILLQTSGSGNSGASSSSSLVNHPRNSIRFLIDADPEMEDRDNDELYRLMQDQVTMARQQFSKMEQFVALRYQDCELEDVGVNDDESDEQMNRDLDMISEMKHRVQEMCHALLQTVHQMEVDGKAPRDYWKDLFIMSTREGEDQPPETERGDGNYDYDAECEDESQYSSDFSDSDSMGNLDAIDPRNQHQPLKTNQGTTTATATLTPEEIRKHEAEELEKEIQEMTSQLKSSTMAIHLTLRDQTKVRNVISCEKYIYTGCFS